MRIHPDGYTVEMTAKDVMDSVSTDINMNVGDGNLNEGELWCASCFGPMVDHDIVLFKSIDEALNWIYESIGEHTVDEMSFWCWKDVYDTGTEWEIRKIQIPN